MGGGEWVVGGGWWMVRVSAKQSPSVTEEEKRPESATAGRLEESCVAPSLINTLLQWGCNPELERSQLFQLQGGW